MLLNEIYERHPDEKTAFIFKDEFMTYGDFRKKVKDWAMFLQAQGVRQGDRVGLFSKNSPDFVAAYFAVVKAGAIVVPFNFQLIPDYKKPAGCESGAAGSGLGTGVETVYL